MTTLTRFNPFSPAFHADPYSTYARLQREDPVHWSFLNAWVITRYADVMTALKDASFQVDDLPERLQQKNHLLARGDINPLSKTVGAWLFFLEGSDHARLRGLARKTFSSSTVESIRPLVQKWVDELIDSVAATGQMDVMRDFAEPLPAMVIAHVLGVPRQDFHRLVRWSAELFFVLDQPVSIAGCIRQNEAAIEARDYLRDLIAQREKQPADGLISQLIAARDQGQKLSLDEVLGFCIMLFIVGQETTKYLIGNAVLALLNHPGQLAFVRNHPDQVKAVVNELIRYESSVPIVARKAIQDIEMSGKTIRAGDRLIVCIGAANRDPERFDHPDQLDWNRKPTNLPFGGGLHHCLGAPLARMQSQIAIQSLAERLPRLRRKAEPLKWRTSIAIRGLYSLPVAFD